MFASQLAALLLFAQTTPQDRGRWLGMMIGFMVIALASLVFLRMKKKNP